MWHRESDTVATSYTYAEAITIQITSNIPVIDFVTDSYPIIRYISDSVATSGSGPSNTSIINSYWYNNVIKFNYSSSLLSDIGIKSNDEITAILFKITEAPSSAARPFKNYQIAYKNSSISADTNPGNSGWIVVRQASDWNFLGSSTGDMSYEVGTLEDPIIYTGGTLSFSFGWGKHTYPNYGNDGETTVFYPDSTLAKMWYLQNDDGSGAYNSGTSAIYTRSYVPVLGFKLGKK